MPDRQRNEILGLEELDEIQKAASAKIKAIYGSQAEAVANEQVRLALEARDERVRHVAGKAIVESIIGGPTQRVDVRSQSIRVISHLDLPTTAEPVGLVGGSSGNKPPLAAHKFKMIAEDKKKPISVYRKRQIAPETVIPAEVVKGID